MDTTLNVISLIGTILTTFTGLIITYRGIVKQIKTSKEERMVQVEKSLNELKLDITDLRDDVKVISKDQDKNELYRLKESIVLFSDKLQQLQKDNDNHHSIKESAFLIMFDNYERYKKLGGNGYIDQEMSYIKGVHKDLYKVKEN